MFVVNEDKSIYLTRGDMASLKVSAEDDSGNHVFQIGDVLRLQVMEKKAAENVVLRKEVTVKAQTEEVEIVLTGADTTFGEVISKPVDYWYEIELNPDTMPQTIVGYDEDGAKLFRLYPEGAEV